MNYIVLNLEWNQPLSKSRMVRRPIALGGEIIQIGAVKLDENLEQIDEFDQMVKPVHYTKMNKYVKELTKITDEDLETGISFEEAMENFKEWCGEECLFLTWGSGDVSMIRDNCIVYGLDYQWLPQWVDAQLMFDDLLMMEGRQFSLDYAVYYLKIKGNNGHNALNDAIDTAAVIRSMDEALEWISEELDYKNGTGEYAEDYEDDYEDGYDEDLEDEDEPEEK